jgi:hypothetical protein
MSIIVLLLLLAPIPNNSSRVNEPPVTQTPPIMALGSLTTLTMEQHNGRIVATPQDRSMARIYRLCDDSGSPRYLADAILSQMRKEIVQNQVDLCHS